MRKLFLTIIAAAGCLTAFAADPMATNYTMSQCEGSLTPYPTEINPAVFPDSLRPVFINHVGRHGARYPASSANCLKLQRALNRADSLGTITRRGKLYWKCGRRAEAITDFNSAVALDPQSPAGAYLDMTTDIMDFYNTDLYNP